jgi:hypothetical protein
MAEKFTKTVLISVEVSSSNFCWDGRAPCPHFDNEGGHPSCDLELDYKGKGSGLRYNKEGIVIKPSYCAMLKEDKNHENFQQVSRLL